MFFRHSSTSFSSAGKSMQGSALMIAIFIIVIMTLLGTALLQTHNTSSAGIAQEVLGTRALAAARSGMQQALQNLFPLNTNIPTLVCQDITLVPIPALIPITIDFTLIPNLNGLNQCNANVTCAQYFVDSSDPTNPVTYYRLTSTGNCGSGAIQSFSVAGNNPNVVNASRTVQVEASNLR